MILKKLEIAGFKSFGKKVELDFGVPITAIVGPNGSGKSNVSEAIRWVLGEQSMKSLRGKRGEDLIFHGSGGAAQLGKARVGITFDNSAQTFPVDFSEIVVSREVYRDGANEYRINDSLVRLKDVIELMSHVGVGGSGHHIISQGEADRVLYASPKDRKNMVEDALGLRIYHIKQEEAERKLAATKENMREVALLRREIQPHMRFLKEQAAKIEVSKKLHEELTETLRVYLARESYSLAEAEAGFKEKELPLKETLAKAEKEADCFRKTISEKQRIIASSMPPEIEEAVRRLMALEEERRTLERDAGRMEGKLAALQHANKKTHEAVALSTMEVESELHDLLTLIEKAAFIESLHVMGEHLLQMKEHIQNFLLRITQKREEAKREEEEIDLQREHDDILHRLMLNEEERKVLLEKKTSWDTIRKESEMSFWEDQKFLRAAEELVSKTRDVLRSLEIEREHIKMRQDEYRRQEEEAEPLLGGYIFEAGEPPAGDVQETWTDEKRMEAQRAIQRFHIKLEEAGGINPEVVKEYEEVQSRDAFLAKELEDLTRTERSLHDLMADLEKELKQEFADGIDKINEEFTQLFETMFGGGGANLALIRLQKRGGEDEETEDAEEMGVDVTVDIPKKRVKNLDMLSGGERALTSIALLFAMSFVNPPPFLVLDETDAALDEANSQRYGAMLRNLSDKTQLLVITHNRQTMKEAGVLYGVTMGADGVSRLLSLKFKEATEVSGPPHES